MELKKTFHLHNTSHSFPNFIFCGEKTFAPFEVHTRRIFPVFNMIFVKKGTLCLREGDEEYRILENEYFIQTPNILHYGIRPQAECVSFFYIHFLPQEQWEILLPSDRQHPSFTILNTGYGTKPPKFDFSLPMHYKCSKSLLQSAENLVKNYSTLTLPASQSTFLDILWQILKPEGSDIHHADTLNRILLLTQEHFLDENFTLDKLADELNLSRQYVSKCLKEKTGSSFRDYLLYLRIDYAKKQLSSGSIRINEIAEQLGYSDISAFSHMFKKQTGKSPLAYYRDSFSGLP